jgi:hypothetical protein
MKATSQIVSGVFKSIGHWLKSDRPGPAPIRPSILKTPFYY